MAESIQTSRGTGSRLGAGGGGWSSKMEHAQWPRAQSMHRWLLYQRPAPLRPFPWLPPLFVSPTFTLSLAL
ncbi:unnamed protein product [Nezara viridula]|uniref:Uncharacterized protein n=1 Tax=Nezara viridula TaxID=85310 RepID=A0A9P0H6Y5_NEZVI|nr:unnamed protein product [Nezara viridula]